MGRSILRINSNETSIRLYQGAHVGNNFDLNGAPAVQNASLAIRRLCATLAAIICDAPHIQPLLPQFLICNKRLFPQALLATLRAGLPKYVLLLHQRSAWNNNALRIWIIGQLQAALPPYAAMFLPSLLFEAATIHINAKVLAACGRAGVLLVMIPSKITCR